MFMYLNCLYLRSEHTTNFVGQLMSDISGNLINSRLYFQDNISFRNKQGISCWFSLHIWFREPVIVLMFPAGLRVALIK